MKPKVRHFLHDASNTFTYVVHAPGSSAAAVIDPVLDYNQASGRTGTDSAERVLRYIRDNGLQLEWILETHAHADHLSAAAWLKQELGGRIGIGAGIREVQSTFRKVFNLKTFNADGREFDHLFADDESFSLGAIDARVINTPGHTSDSVSYVFGDAVFVGDSLFAPDSGTARTDFPGGSAALLYDSTQRLLALPDDTRVYLCHDYPGDKRSFEPVHSVREQRARNIHVGERTSKDEYVRIREARDATLAMPALIIPAIQVNIRAGRLPETEDNDVSYLKIPLNLLGG
jgi:glyoxylase-like metal-dependent hydrolase (beta-lactamase superfamily II)